MLLILCEIPPAAQSPVGSARITPPNLEETQTPRKRWNRDKVLGLEGVAPGGRGREETERGGKRGVAERKSRRQKTAGNLLFKEFQWAQARKSPALPAQLRLSRP